LYDSHDGTPEEASGDCPNPLPTWAQAATVTALRFDPNENITCISAQSHPSVPCSNFHQQVDWLRLSQVSQVQRGNPFVIGVTLSKLANQVTSTFYVTTNPSNPTQVLAQAYTAQVQDTSG